MKISIIIPVYNMEKYIVSTLTSITDNVLENVEIIVINDGSNDNTKEIVESFFTQNPHLECKLIHQTNAGVSVARNKGIEAATGDMLIFCDSDDLCSKDMIETVCRETTKDIDMLVWRYWTENNGQKILSQEEFSQQPMEHKEVFKNFILDTYRIRLGNFAVKKKVLDQYHIRFTSDCKYGEDLEFAYKCLAVSPKIKTINDILYTYIRRKGTAVSTYNIRRFDAPLAIQRVYDFTKENTALLEDESIDNYLHCGLFILHSIFSFDACIMQVEKSKMNKLWQEYRNLYPNLEKMISQKSKSMRMLPSRISQKRVRMFMLNRYVYIWIYGLKK